MRPAVRPAADIPLVVDLSRGTVAALHHLRTASASPGIQESPLCFPSPHL